MNKICTRCQHPNRDKANFCVQCRRPLPAMIYGTPLGFRTVGTRREVVALTANDRRRHIYTIGATGVGKSTFLLNLINHDLKAGNGLAVIDPKGDLIDNVLRLIPPQRIEQVIYINPADNTHSVGINPLESVPAELRSLAAAEMVSILQRLFPSWGAQLERYLRYASLTLLEVPGTTLAEMPLLFRNLDFRHWALQFVTDPLVHGFWQFELGEKSGHSGTLSALLNRVEPFLSDLRVRHIIGQSHSTFDIRRAMDTGRIILADLSKGKIGEHASNLLGGLLISKIQLAAMARANVPKAKRPDFYLYVDEFQNVASGSAAFAAILSEARAFNLSLTLAHQYVSQIDASVRDAIFGNVGNLVVFRIGPQDANIIARQMPPLRPSDFVSLSNYTANTKISPEGQPLQPFILFNYQPPDSENNMTVNEVCRISRKRYTQPWKDIEDKIQQRHLHWQGLVEMPSSTPTIKFEDDEEDYFNEE